MANSDAPADIDNDTFIDNAAWAFLRNIPHSIKSLTRYSNLFGQDTIFDVPFVADW